MASASRGGVFWGMNMLGGGKGLACW